MKKPLYRIHIDETRNPNIARISKYRPNGTKKVYDFVENSWVDVLEGALIPADCFIEVEVRIIKENKE